MIQTLQDAGVVVTREALSEEAVIKLKGTVYGFVQSFALETCFLISQLRRL
jgi:hypothetical protein